MKRRAETERGYTYFINESPPPKVGSVATWYFYRFLSGCTGERIMKLRDIMRLGFLVWLAVVGYAGTSVAGTITIEGKYTSYECDLSANLTPSKTLLAANDSHDLGECASQSISEPAPTASSYFVDPVTSTATQVPVVSAVDQNGTMGKQTVNATLVGAYPIPGSYPPAASSKNNVVPVIGSANELSPTCGGGTMCGARLGSGAAALLPISAFGVCKWPDNSANNNNAHFIPYGQQSD
jgi:hypothetical protein